MMKTEKNSLSNDAMKTILEKHVRISPEAEKRIKAKLFAKLEEKRSPIFGFSHRTAMAIFALVASIIITVSLLFIFELVSMSNPPTAKVVDCWNYCRISKADGKIGKITKDTELAVGDMLITGPDAGISIKTADGSFVSVGRNSQLEYVAPRGGKKCTFFLHCGSILAKVSPDKTKLFSVKTPGALLKVIGTEFEAKVFGDSIDKMEKNKMKKKIKNKTATLTTLTVLSGIVALSPSQAADKLVKAGYTADMSNRNTVIKKIKSIDFIKSATMDNYRKKSSFWFERADGKNLVNSIYKYNIANGKAEAVANFIGYAHLLNYSDNGAVVNLHTVLVGSTQRLSTHCGCHVFANNLIILNSEGYNELNLEVLAGYNPSQIALSPDGTKLAFVGGKDGKYGLWVMNLKNMEANMFLKGGMKTDPAWSPDSSTILISSSQGYCRNHRIVAINVNTKKVTRTAYSGCGVVFSPDGSKIAFPGSFKRGGAWLGGVPMFGDLYIADYPGGKAVKLTDIKKGGVILPEFSPNGKKLTYWHHYNSKKTVLHCINLKDGKDITLFTLEASKDNPRVTQAQTAWTDNTEIVLKIRDKNVAKRITFTGDSFKINDIPFTMEANGFSKKLNEALKKPFDLYLAGLRSACLNKLNESLENYRKAYAALLQFKNSNIAANPKFCKASLTPYLTGFKKAADMDYKALYIEQLHYRMGLFPYMLNNYIRKYKKLPESMDKLAGYMSEHGSFNYIMAKTPEAKIQFLMPDQKPGSTSKFKLKVIDKNNIEFSSAPTPWGEGLKTYAVKKRGYWRPKEKNEPSLSSSSLKVIPESPKITEAIEKDIFLEFGRATDNSLFLECGINQAPVDVAFTAYGKREGGSDKWEAFSGFNCKNGDSNIHTSIRYSFFSGLSGGKYRFKFKFVPNKKRAVVPESPLESPLESYYGGTVETDWMTLTVPPDQVCDKLSGFSSFRIVSNNSLKRDDQLFEQKWTSFKLRPELGGQYRIGSGPSMVKTSPFKFNPNKPKATVIRMVELKSTDTGGKKRTIYNISHYGLYYNTAFPFYGLDGLFPEPGNYYWQAKVYFFSMSDDDMLTEKIAVEDDGKLMIGVGVCDSGKAQKLLRILQKKYPVHSITLPDKKITVIK